MDEKPVNNENPAADCEPVQSASSPTRETPAAATVGPPPVRDIVPPPPPPQPPAAHAAPPPPRLKVAPPPVKIAKHPPVVPRISQWLDNARGWLASLAFHLALLALLAMWIIHRSPLPGLQASATVTIPKEAAPPQPVPSDVVAVGGVSAGTPKADLPGTRPVSPAATVWPQLPPGMLSPGGTPQAVVPQPVVVNKEPPAGVGASAPGEPDAADPAAGGGKPGGNDLSSRTGNIRRELLVQYGGSDNSEAAVMAALKWLAEHQLSDGSWSLQMQTHLRCHGQCKNPGSLLQARVAATSLALLPFLGAGNTHQEGRYKQNVRSGVYFLINQIHKTPAGGALNEPSGAMYSHGLASIALCEVYAMTHDRALAHPAQLAVNFICFAQDPLGGGWRYQPQTPGDTSVSGWQIMALKSARMADLLVSPRIIGGASHFLDSVQTADGARYGYTSPDSQPSMSAIGLLCRMYLGWRQDMPALKQGVAELAAMGPNVNDLYYTYYATQVLRHWGGPLWEKWNTALRDPLIALQSQQGHETGSWFIEKGDQGSRAGGRLYCTSMATMILEVYYRHLPLYSRKTTHEEFPN